MRNMSCEKFLCIVCSYYLNIICYTKFNIWILFYCYIRYINYIWIYNFFYIKNMAGVEYLMVSGQKIFCKTFYQIKDVCKKDR